VTLELVYSSYKLTTAKIGTSSPSTFRTYSYDAIPKLTKIEDGESSPKTIAEFKYQNQAGLSPGKLVRIETPDGAFGWEYAASGGDSGAGTYVTYQRSRLVGLLVVRHRRILRRQDGLTDSSTGICSGRTCLAVATTLMTGWRRHGRLQLLPRRASSWDTASSKLNLQGRKSSRADGGGDI
jgi:hypothetical protein